MRLNHKSMLQIIFILFISVIITSCVTETTHSPTVKFNDAAVISVSNPGSSVIAGSTFAWLPEAIRFYDDERLADVPVKKLIEKEIKNNIVSKEFVFVESASNAKYTIAYTAALESSLDDSEVISRFGLLPGMANIPKDDANIEKGNLIIYVFDNRSGDVIWRSAAQVGVEFDMSDEQRHERITRVVAEMLQTLPIRK